MRHYTQLTQEQRYQIYALLKGGKNQTDIALIVGVHKSTISREICRNRGRRGYRPEQAQQRCLQRRQDKISRRITAKNWRKVERLLQKQWSPQQVSGWLNQNSDIRVSHEWIYQHVLADKHQGGTLYTQLRCQKQRKKRYGRSRRQGCIPNQVSIEQRPAIVDSRRRFGDWELDTVIGRHHQQALVTLVERKSKFLLIAKVAHKTAHAVTQAVLALLKPFRQWVHTITVDNGKEFAQHAVIAKQLKTRVYFAHPFSSWERGLNENTNGLIRQYFPKKSDFTRITPRHINIVMERLNNRPRQTLGFKSPIQVFSKVKPNVALTS